MPAAFGRQAQKPDDDGLKTIAVELPFVDCVGILLGQAPAHINSGIGLDCFSVFMGRNKGRLLNGLDTALIERGEAGGLAHAHFRWRAALVYQ